MCGEDKRVPGKGIHQGISAACDLCRVQTIAIGTIRQRAALRFLVKYVIVTVLNLICKHRHSFTLVGRKITSIGDRPSPVKGFGIKSPILPADILHDGVLYGFLTFLRPQSLFRRESPQSTMLVPNEVVVDRNQIEAIVSRITFESDGYLQHSHFNIRRPQLNTRL